MSGLTGRHLRIRFTEAHHPARRALRIRSLRRDADSRSRVVRALASPLRHRRLGRTQTCAQDAHRATASHSLRTTIRTRRTQRTTNS